MVVSGEGSVRASFDIDLGDNELQSFSLGGVSGGATDDEDIEGTDEDIGSDDADDDDRPIFGN